MEIFINLIIIGVMSTISGVVVPTTNLKITHGNVKIKIF